MFGQKMKSAFFATAAAGAMVVGLGVGPAAALPIDGLYVNGENHLSDNSAEWLVKGANNTQAGIVEVGDRLVGVAGINTIEPNGNGIGFGTGFSELTAYFDIMVTAKTSLTCGSLFCFQFGPTGSFNPTGFASNPLTMIAFYEDPSNNYTRLGTQATLVANATDGAAYWSFGKTGDDFWAARTDTDNILAGGSAAPGTPFGQFNLGVSVLENILGPTLAPRACLNTSVIAAPVNTFADACGQGGLNAKDGASDANSFDDVNFFINVSQVPEPSTLSLFGVGLLGLGFSFMRRSKAKA